jgi:HlyD family secretion protein
VTRHPAHTPILIGCVTLALLLAGLLGWAMTTRLAGAIIAPGVVQVDQNRQIVQHPEGGVVTRIATAEGRLVAQGDLLLQLDTRQPQADLALVTAQLADTRARLARLTAERDGTDLVLPSGLDPAETRAFTAERALFLMRRASLAQQIADIASQHRQITLQADAVAEQIRATKRQITLIRAELADQQALRNRGLAPQAQLRALQREEARLLGLSGELVAARTQTAARSTALAQETTRLTTTHQLDVAVQLGDTTRAERDLAAQHHRLTARINASSIRAPTAGRVLGLAVTTPQAVIRAGDPVLYLIPQDRPLQIAARLPPLYSAQAHPGQSVRLVFPALAALNAPDLTGQVASISADVLADPAGGPPFFRADITLPPAEMARLPPGTLSPGQPVEVFFLTGERTPLAYLLAPLSRYFDRAFRESG